MKDMRGGKVTQASQSIGIIRVFLASPSDVTKERESLSGVINELNRTLRALLPNIGVRLELVRWETNAFPAMGRPQGVILEEIGEYDIFIGILWKRFGTPTGRAQSGTEEEFMLAYDTWKQTGKPHILIYFNRASIPPPRTTDEIEQLSKVVKFRDALSKIGLIWEYDDATLFPDVVRPHLTEVIGNLIQHGPAYRRSLEDEAVSELQTPSAPSGERGGLQVRITEIGEDDAFYKRKDEIVGSTGVLIESMAIGDWYVGKVRFDGEILGVENPEIPFYQFQYETA
jgi:hypothetical protein